MRGALLDAELAHLEQEACFPVFLARARARRVWAENRVDGGLDSPEQRREEGWGPRVPGPCGARWPVGPGGFGPPLPLSGGAWGVPRVLGVLVISTALSIYCRIVAERDVRCPSRILGPGVQRCNHCYTAARRPTDKRRDKQEKEKEKKRPADRQ
eukprot:scaffold7994_cov122-Isochrysis_galbana.AAC.18